jgi:hypothetical protein
MFACAPGEAAKETAWRDVGIALRHARAEADALGASGLSADMQRFFDVVKEWKENL